MSSPGCEIGVGVDVVVLGQGNVVAVELVGTGEVMVLNYQRTTLYISVSATTCGRWKTGSEEVNSGSEDPLSETAAVVGAGE